MRYDRDMWRRGPRSHGEYSGRGGAASGGGGGLRGEYGQAYEGPFSGHGWSEGFLGGELRSRGSWDPRNQDTFEWGGGYIGGRGYGGGNYDLEHGYATGAQSFGTRPPRGGAPREDDPPFSSSAGRGGYAWGEAEASEEYGPARYGYGPYFDRLRRRRRSDDELRQEVEDTLFYDTWVDADAISITVEDGVVTLRGTLPNYEELRYAVDDAWDVDGVRGVRSELDVREQGQQDSGRAVRYQPGAPHMHGHPQAGEEADSAGGAERESAGTRERSSRGAGSARPPARATAGRGSRRGADVDGDSGTPVPGSGQGNAPSAASASTRAGRGGRSRGGKQASAGRAASGAGKPEAGQADDGSVGLPQS